MSKSWSEVEQALEEKRCELVFTGPLYSERIVKDGLDPGIFKIKHLNFLEISKAALKCLPSDIGELSNLTRIVVCYNELSSLPPEICKLKKLKFLDVSHNHLTELPAELSKLVDLQSLNVSSNELSNIPPINEMSKLVTLNICYNKFESLPVSICDSKLIHFTDLIANNNNIAEIPPEIGQLGSLKILDLGVNEINSIPGELGNCTKLKELNLKGNKLKDKRLLKLVEQCHVKQVMDYIRSHCPKANADNNKQSKSKKKTKQSKKSEAEEVVEMLDELTIYHVSDELLKVVVTAKVCDVRPYIVCCKVQNVDLKDGSILKKFITAQTKLHDGICEKRTVATIATHDFDKLQGNLLYDARPPQEIKILPLNRKKDLTAAELYTQLNEEADAIRKEKKKNTYSGIHKYLYLLKDKPLYPCLLDSSGTVISFPPITNSDGSKISNETRNILLEVTGNNLSTCKKVMDTLLVEMLKLGLGDKNQKEIDDDTQKNTLSVQQIKVVDEEGQLKVVYPSRTDIQFDGILVTRT
ncbi:leucine-rich repeat-containing protein 47-like [Uloborus diversus]|uniref:leucine-rich repeat-containing protein 47-like n=1 Tax=Uloborus diversus TaxID=327109 RepID=UPI002408FCB7|nr:leucine-rich repeat-containing protein 47-like [Uloborus diversus]